VSTLSLELVALAIIVIYLAVYTLGQPEKGEFFIRLVLVSAASWIAEESCILSYRFYSYSPTWTLFLADVPLLVIVIWPIIVHSAWDLASQMLQPGHRFVPLAGAAIVLTDAFLLEPVGVHIGLWSWKEPGIFEVPPIGILGWAYFAFLCMLHFGKGRRRSGTRRTNLFIPLIPVLGTHLLLLITWWAALRWAKITVDPRLAVGVAWMVSILLVYAILRNRTGTRVEKKTLWLRLLGALFLFTWLALNGDDSKFLIVYGVAFAPPYLTLMTQQYMLGRKQRVCDG
jgi:uncharacterized membrane protein